MACEKCWEDASMRAMFDGRSIGEIYAELLKERKDNPCTPEQEKYGNHMPESEDAP